jgi:hypothetical protein
MHWTSGVATAPDRKERDVVRGIASKVIECHVILYYTATYERTMTYGTKSYDYEIQANTKSVCVSPPSGSSYRPVDWGLGATVFGGFLDTVGESP